MRQESFVANRWGGFNPINKHLGGWDDDDDDDDCWLLIAEVVVVVVGGGGGVVVVVVVLIVVGVGVGVRVRVVVVVVVVNVVDVVVVVVSTKINIFVWIFWVIAEAFFTSFLFVWVGNQINVTLFLEDLWLQKGRELIGQHQDPHRKRR